MKKRCIALFLAVIVAFGGIGLRPQKAYAFAFAPAMVPLVVSLLGMAGIFVTGVHSTSDLNAKMEEFVLSDGAIAEFVSGLFAKASVGPIASVVLGGDTLIFFVDTFIDYARNYFSQAKSDAFIDGTVFRDAKELENPNLKVPAKTVFSGLLSLNNRQLYIKNDSFF